MDRRTIILIPFLIILILLAGFASAQDIQIAFNVNEPAQTINICGNATYTYSLSNFGDFIETFDIGVEPFPDDTLLTVNPVVIAPGETKTLEMAVFPPCDTHGKFDVRMFLKERQTGTLFEARSSLDIIPLDVADIAAETDSLRVDFQSLLLEIPVENLGPTEATYELTLEGEDWVSLQEDTLIVDAGNIGNAQVISNPPEDTEEGNYPLTLVVKSTTTGLEYAKEFDLRLGEPSLLEELTTTYLTFTIIGMIVLLLLIIALAILIIYLARTQEERAFRREERRREKEKLKEEKRLLKEETKRLKQEAKEAKKREKEEAKRIKLEEKEAKKNAKEQAKEEAQRLKAEEKAAKQEEKRQHVFSKKREKLKPLMFAELRHEYRFILKDPTMKKSKKPLLFVIILIIALIVAGYFFWSTVQPYSFYILAGVGIAVALFVLVEGFRYFMRQRLLRFFDDTVKKEVKGEVKGEAIAFHELIKKEHIKHVRPKRSLRQLILFVVVILLIIVSLLFRPHLLELFMPIFGGLCAVLALLALFALFKHMRYTKHNRTVCHGQILAGTMHDVQLRSGKGLGEISYVLKKDVDSYCLRLQRGGRNKAFIVPPGLVYQYLFVHSYGLQNNDVESTTLRFKLPLRWLTKKNIKASDVHMVRYARGKWMKIGDCKQVREDEKFAYFEATHKGLNDHYAIAGKPSKVVEPKPKKTKSLSKREERALVKEAKKEAQKVNVERISKREQRKTKKETPQHDRSQWWKPVVTVLILLVLIAGVIMLGQYFKNLPSDKPAPAEDDLKDIKEDVEQLTDEIAGIENVPPGGIPPQTWEQGQVHRINLNPFFSDPDGEPLDFSNTPLDSITVDYDDGVAVLTPEPGYAGQQTVVFTGTDSNEASVSSNAVVLTVSGDNSVYGSLTRFFGSYGLYVVLGIVLVIIVILIVEVKRRIDEGDEEIEEDFDLYKES